MKSNDPIKNAWALRKEITEAEKKFWKLVRGKKYNSIKFRRQHPVGSFVLDFYWAAGPSPSQIRIIRFTNKEVMDDLVEVLKKIVLFAGA